jgi:TRAP-type C4-dicarboxylate transport system substrate-binding protein
MHTLSSLSTRVAPVRLVIALLLAGLGGRSPVRANENITIRLGTILPSGTAQHQSLQALGEDWLKLSGGTVKLILYPDGRLGGESEMVKKMRIKQLNACVLTAVGLAEIDPGIAGLQVIPLTFRTWEEVDFVREKMRPMLEERLRAKGFEVLFWADAGWVRFFSKEAGVRPDDFKKMKLFTWTGDVRQAEIMRSIGYHPVALETTDILLGLNTDMINVVPVPPLIALASQLYGPAPHMLDLNWSPIVGAAVIRRDVWEKLPRELQAQLRSACDATGEKIRAQSRAESEKSVQVMLQRGLKIHQIPPEAKEDWDHLAAILLPRVRGTTVPEDIFDEVQRLLVEYRRSSTPQQH